MAANAQTGFGLDIQTFASDLMQKVSASILAARQADMAARGNVLADNLSDAELARRDITPLPHRYGFG